MKRKLKRYLITHFIFLVGHNSITLQSIFKPLTKKHPIQYVYKIKTISIPEITPKDYNQFQFFEHPGIDNVYEKFIPAIKEFKSKNFQSDYKIKKDKRTCLP